MTWWDDLSGEVDAAQLALTRQLLDLLPELQAALQGSGNPASVAAEIERRTARGVAYTFSLAGRAQYEQLNPLGREVALLDEAARVLGQRRGRLAAQRALAVLESMTAAMVSPYARLAAQILITDAARTGLRGGGIVGGAKFKKFVRIRQVKEGRAHSALEGVVKPIDEPFVIAGIPVHGPGDERLPISETAWCGHVLEYLRLGEAPALMSAGQGGDDRPDAGQREEVARKALAQAVELAKDFGHAAKVDAAPFLGLEPEFPGAAQASGMYHRGQIYFNPQSPAWKNAEEYMRVSAAAKRLSSPDPRHLAWHEIGHAEHDRHRPRQYQRAEGYRLSEALRERIKREVSTYASGSGREFVAEVWAARRAGRSFDREIMALYALLGGPD